MATDAERLDWIERNTTERLNVVFENTFGTYEVRVTKDQMALTSWFAGETVRDAIDFAMRQTGS